MSRDVLATAQPEKAGTVGVSLGGRSPGPLLRPFSSRPFAAPVVAKDPEPLPLTFLQPAPPPQSLSISPSSPNWSVTLGTAPNVTPDLGTGLVSPVTSAQGDLQKLWRSAPVRNPVLPPVETFPQLSSQNTFGCQQFQVLVEEPQKKALATTTCDSAMSTVHPQQSTACGNNGTSTIAAAEMAGGLSLAQQIEIQRAANQVLYQKLWVQQQMAAQLSLFDTHRDLEAANQASTGASCAANASGITNDVVTKKKDLYKAPGTQLRFPGDWTCAECGDYQFAKNRTCRNCGANRPLKLY